MASFRSLNGRISSHFDNINLKVSAHVYFMVLSHSMRSKYKILKIDFCDNSTNEIYYSTTFVGAA